MVATEYKSDLQTLFDYFTQVKEEIIQIAIQKGMNASGKTLGSLDIVQRPTGMDLYAFDNIYFMEDGRGPTKEGTPGNPNLVEIIAEWLKHKDIIASPYAIAKTIHKKGTKLFRNGGHSGVLSIPLDNEKLQKVFDEMTLYWLAEASSEIYEPINQMINTN